MFVFPYIYVRIIAPPLLLLLNILVMVLAFEFASNVKVGKQYIKVIVDAIVCHCFACTSDKHCFLFSENE